MAEVGGEDGLAVVGALVVGELVGLREPVGTYEMLGESVGLAVVGALVVGLVVGFELGFEHPLVVCTSATTASLHCPLISLYATQMINQGI